MNFTVIISPRALQDLDRAYHWLLERTPQHAPEWYNRAIDAINSLESNPGRCPIAPESPRRGEIIHQLLFGDKRHARRIVFTIREQTVFVLHLTHGARER